MSVKATGAEPRSVPGPGRSGSARGRRVVVIALAGALLGLSLHHFVAAAYQSRAYGFVDFPIFLHRAREFLDSGELYVDPADPAAYVPAAAVYKFPPLYAMLLLPLVRDGVEARVLLQHWRLQIAIYLAAVVVALVVFRPSRASFLLAGALLALNYEPFFETLWRLQIETPLLLLLGLALLAYLRGRGGEGWSGAALGLATMLKLYPGALLVFFVLRRRWRVVAWWAVTVALALISALIVVGPAENARYFLEVLPSMARETPLVSTENLSPGRYLQQLAGLGPELAKRAGQLLALLALVASCALVGRRRESEREREAAAFCLFIPVMLLALPNSWVNYQLLLLLPLFAAARLGLAQRRLHPALASVWIAAWLPTLFYQPCAEPSVPWPCAQTPFFLGLVQLPRGLHDLMVDLRGLSAPLIWGALLYGLRRSPSGSLGGHRAQAETGDLVG